jgi:hypothetical protein
MTKTWSHRINSDLLEQDYEVTDHYLYCIFNLDILLDGTLFERGEFDGIIL